MRTVAIHQSNFFPWAGFFLKMKNSDIFVLLDDVPYTKGSYLNRTKAVLPYKKESEYVTMPVKAYPLQKINEVKISKPLTELSDVLDKLYFGYPSAQEVWSSAVRWDMEKIVDLNVAVIKAIAKQINYKGEIVLSSTLKHGEDPMNRLIDIIQAVDGDRYITGVGGKNYLDEGKFRAAGIQLKFKDFSSHIDVHTGYVTPVKDITVLHYLPNFKIY